MRIPPLALLALCAALAAALAGFLPVMHLDVPGWVVLLVAGAGALFLLPAVTSFVRHKTTVSPLTPSAATTLVRSGVFAVTRNPMYLGMLIVLLAVVLYLGALSGFAALVLFFVLIDRFQIRFEEKQLLETFGAAYRDYARDIPRWLFFGRGLGEE
ncbi:methyltransferase family protein [Nitratireductor sp. CH_MIT9313-5]|uniref:methyltransferase family protein n=1 Tax=Nitratireductor sp. CH_MIT9313-5 TaxID=3107764 RepID=UPI00300A22BA